jgi:D-alanyl-D-alanine carboxypeptidase (penicillin-binding protein 5/6)
LLNPESGKFPGVYKENSALAGKAIIYLDGRAVRSVPIYFKLSKGEESGYMESFKKFLSLAVGIQDNG